MGRLVLAGGATPRWKTCRVWDYTTNWSQFYICKISSATRAGLPINIDPGIRVVPTCSMTTGACDSINGIIPRIAWTTWLVWVPPKSVAGSSLMDGEE
jgi:hypothetical protein